LWQQVSQRYGKLYEANYQHLVANNNDVELPGVERDQTKLGPTKKNESRQHYKEITKAGCQPMVTVLLAKDSQSINNSRRDCSLQQEQHNHRGWVNIEWNNNVNRQNNQSTAAAMKQQLSTTKLKPQQGHSAMDEGPQQLWWIGTRMNRQDSARDCRSATEVQGNCPQGQQTIVLLKIAGVTYPSVTTANTKGQRTWDWMETSKRIDLVEDLIKKREDVTLKTQNKQSDTSTLDGNSRSAMDACATHMTLEPSEAQQRNCRNRSAWRSLLDRAVLHQDAKTKQVDCMVCNHHQTAAGSR
jgi:hypothetical protein